MCLSSFDFKVVIWLSSWCASDAFVCYSKSVDEALGLFLDEFGVDESESIYLRVEEL